MARITTEQMARITTEQMARITNSRQRRSGQSICELGEAKFAPANSYP